MPRHLRRLEGLAPLLFLVAVEITRARYQADEPTLALSPRVDIFGAPVRSCVGLAAAEGLRRLASLKLGRRRGASAYLTISAMERPSHRSQIGPLIVLGRAPSEMGRPTGRIGDFERDESQRSARFSTGRGDVTITRQPG